MDWRVVAVALAALAAGCGGFAGTAGEPTPTVTPVPVPTASPTPEDPRVGVAPGLSTRGVTDAGYLAENHVAAARETSYVWNESEASVRRFGNGSVNTSDSRTVTYENGTAYHFRSGSRDVGDGGATRYVQNYAAYADGDVAYRTWLVSGDEHAYRRDGSPSGSLRYASLAADPIRRYLALEEATVTRVDAGDGTYYRVVGTRSSLPASGPVDNYTARALVRSDGFVRSLDVRYVTTRDQEVARVHYNFTYHEVGTAAVTEPGWVSQAREYYGD